MRKTLLTLTALGAGLLPLAGCTPEGEAFGRGLVLGGIQSYVNSAASERGRMAANPANAMPPQTNINVYNPQPQQTRVQYIPREEPKLIEEGIGSMTGYSDKDGDGVLSQADIDNLNKRKFDLAEGKDIIFFFSKIGYTGKIEWEISPPEGKKEKLETQAVGDRLNLLTMNKDGIRLSGNYVVSATTDDGKTYSMKVEIITKKRWNENTPVGLFAYTQWEDEDKDGYIERKELSGLGKKVLDLDKEDLAVALNLPNQKGKVTFRTLNMDGKVIGESIIDNPDSDIIQRFTSPDGPTQGDFMDYLRGAGSGKYKITARVEGVENEFSMDIEVKNTGRDESKKPEPKADDKEIKTKEKTE